MNNLHEAVMGNDLDSVRQLLLRAKEPVKLVNAVDGNGMSPLYAAVKESSTDIGIIKLLLDAGADPNFERSEMVEDIPLDYIESMMSSLDNIDLSAVKQLSEFPKIEQRTHLLVSAIATARIEVLELLRNYGANFEFVDQEGISLLLRAVYASQGKTDIVEYLSSLELNLVAKSSEGESLLEEAYKCGHFDIMKLLISKGADPSRVKLSSLAQAVCLGTPADVARELHNTSNLAEKDARQRTIIHLAALRGDLDIMKLLLDAGADIEQADDNGETCLFYTAQGGMLEVTKLLVERGCPVNKTNDFGCTALLEAAEYGQTLIVKYLLESGADPNVHPDYTSPIESAANRESVKCLLDHGADERHLNSEAIRVLLGFTNIKDPYAGITKKEYRSYKSVKEGKANPEDMTNPLWVSAIRSGDNTYRIQTHFGDSGKTSWRGAADWCADRFGQSVTRLSDGRLILIGGEHEDYYDPDFYIYNDVFIIEPNGGIRIYGYPRSIFPPTDFHSATLCDTWIYIIGGLGYPEQRHGPTPVFRLSLKDFHIEKVETTGDDPGRLSRHRARLDGNAIVVWSGSREDEDEKMTMEYRFDLLTKIWSHL